MADVVFGGCDGARGGDGGRMRGAAASRFRGARARADDHQVLELVLIYASAGTLAACGCVDRYFRRRIAGDDDGRGRQGTPAAGGQRGDEALWRDAAARDMGVHSSVMSQLSRLLGVSCHELAVSAHSALKHGRCLSLPKQDEVALLVSSPSLGCGGGKVAMATSNPRLQQSVIMATPDTQRHLQSACRAALAWLDAIGPRSCERTMLWATPRCRLLLTRHAADCRDDTGAGPDDDEPTVSSSFAGEGHLSRSVASGLQQASEDIDDFRFSVRGVSHRFFSTPSEALADIQECIAADCWGFDILTPSSSPPGAPSLPPPPFSPPSACWSFDTLKDCEERVDSCRDFLYASEGRRFLRRAVEGGALVRLSMFCSGAANAGARFVYSLGRRGGSPSWQLHVSWRDRTNIHGILGTLINESKPIEPSTDSIPELPATEGGRWGFPVL